MLEYSIFVMEYAMFKFFKRKKDNNTTFKYSALGPVVDYGEFKHYIKMLGYAINKGCTNIAITGPYGCGKSSVFRTFEAYQKQLLYKVKKIIYVSLATFDEKNKDNDNFSLEIEKSILQQLFYKVKSKDIHFSRFNKIINISRKEIFYKVFILLITIIIGVLLIKPEWLATLIYNYRSYSFIVSPLVYWILLGLFTILLLTMLTRLSRFVFKRLRVSKFNLKITEFVVNDGDESIFNKYLDEIIYFFEATKYDIVVIEDLDRFENTNIFIKLRELNYLINTSDHVKQTVSFVYAVGDSIFDDYERTKFFDLIVPIIPFVNRTNSGEKLYEIIVEKDLERELPKEYIYYIAVYIDDMRILKNTVNEYLLYKNKIDINYSDYIPLFSLMLYKNLYPSDFELIDKNDGLLFNVFNNKKLFIKEAIEKMKKQLNDIDKDIINVDNEHLETIEELNVSFLSNVLRTNSTLYLIKVDNISISISKDNFYSKSINWESFENFDYIYFHYRQGPTKTYNYEQFNKEFSINGLTYYERYLNIKDSKEIRVKKYKDIYTQLNKDLNNINEFSIQDYINKYGIPDILSEDNNDLLIFLIREGYIKENYYDYISNFYNGRLTKGDVEFILSVQNRKALPFDYSLNKKDEIIERLEGKYFKNKETLNFHLLSYLLDHSFHFIDEITNIMTQFEELNTYKARFIDEYMI